MKKQPKPACSYCFDKKFYTVFRGEKGYDDFGNKTYEKPGEIKKIPCPRCTKKPSLLSKCCHEPLLVSNGGQNGTSYYYCEKCKKPSDPWTVTDSNTKCSCVIFASCPFHGEHIMKSPYEQYCRENMYDIDDKKRERILARIVRKHKDAIDYPVLRISHLIADVTTGKYGTKDRAELLSRLQDIYLSLNK